MSIIPNLSQECLDTIECIIDSDPHKEGLYVPNTSIPILSFDSAAKLSPQRILILALSYIDEITEIITSSHLNDLELYTLSLHCNIERIYPFLSAK